jgi:hypothetical protein
MHAASRGATSQQAAAAAIAAAGAVPQAQIPSNQPAASGPPRPPQDPRALVGVVSHLSKGLAPWNGRPAAMQVWTFRVEGRLGTAQSAQSPVIEGVELRAFEIHGTLENGDWVEISEHPKRGEEGYLPSRLRNLTTNGLVTAKRKWILGEPFDPRKRG